MNIVTYLFFYRSQKTKGYKNSEPAYAGSLPIN